MLKLGFLLCLLILLQSSDCNSQKQDQRITSLESDVKQLKADIAELKQKKAEPEHHYELRSEGFRTFRFDPATGETCIQLTTDADWKRKGTKAQSCNCYDLRQQFLEMPRNTDAERQYATTFSGFVKDACVD